MLGLGLVEAWSRLVQGWSRAIGLGLAGPGVFICSVVAGANEKHIDFLMSTYSWSWLVQDDSV